MLKKSICRQFHQHFTLAFLPIFLRQKIAKPKCKDGKAAQSTFVLKTCAKNVDEIDTCRVSYQPVWGIAVYP